MDDEKVLQFANEIINCDDLLPEVTLVAFFYPFALGLMAMAILLG